RRLPCQRHRFGGRERRDRGHHRHPPGRRLAAGGEDVTLLVEAESRALAERAERHDALAAALDQPADVAAKDFEIDGEIGSKRCGDRREDAAPTHGSISWWYGWSSSRLGRCRVRWSRRGPPG